MEERAFFRESETTKPATLNCPFCRTADTYDLRWMLRKKLDQVPRGAIFLFISAKAMATMEFLQQEWINNGNFMDLGDERDPTIGLQEDGATFTIPRHPVRRRVNTPPLCALPHRKAHRMRHDAERRRSATSPDRTQQRR